MTRIRICLIIERREIYSRRGKRVARPGLKLQLPSLELCSMFCVPRRETLADSLEKRMATTTELVPELLEAGVHFGHQTKRWNPKMKPYIFEKRNAIYIINLDETVQQLHRATEFLQEVTRRGGKIFLSVARNRRRKPSRKRRRRAANFT